jgi:hypothetical protein
MAPRISIKPPPVVPIISIKPDPVAPRRSIIPVIKPAPVVHKPVLIKKALEVKSKSRSTERAKSVESVPEPAKVPRVKTERVPIQSHRVKAVEREIKLIPRYKKKRGLSLPKIKVPKLTKMKAYPPIMPKKRIQSHSALPRPKTFGYP